MSRQTVSTVVLVMLLISHYLLQGVTPIPPAYVNSLGWPVEPPGNPPALGEGTIDVPDDITLTEEQRQLLTGYMDAYYASLARLTVEYPEALFHPSAAANVEADRAVWEITVAIRGMQQTDLHLDRYSYGLVVTKVTEEEDGNLRVRLEESNVQNFRQYPGVDTESRNVGHTFELTEDAGRWYISRHRGGGTVSHTVMGGRHYPFPSDVIDIMAPPLETKATIIADAQANVEARHGIDPAPNGGGSSPDVDHAYDRDAALAYAERWTFGRNPEWPVYDEYGGNCANFTSQCLLAGGIPMDYRGADQWKWYGEAPSLRQRASGRSPSWASVDAFYEYVTMNDGFGLVAEADADYWSGEPGDILQLGFLGDWRHAVVITEVIKDADGRTVDYLLSSNTADQRNFPASAYSYTMQRLIKIHGWND